MTRDVFGLRWRKLDLHVHTPASRDYAGPSITPDEFVAKTISKGLSAIAITDHNSGEWIDRMKAAAKGTSLTVFPGVEVSVTGGKGGVHIIALFDCDATTKTVENLLANLKFDSQEYGNLDAISPLGPESVVEAIHEAGGLAVLAHADSSKGVLNDMVGQQRIKVMNSPYLSAVEIKNVEKTAPYCSGKDPNYKRKLAYYRSSDNRVPVTDDGQSIDGIGSRFSWFKSDGLSLEALKQVFNDPDMRILCDEQSIDIPDQMYPRVLSIRVSQGFLKDMMFEFHEGLNSIIGGKGVGKSVLIELIRFCLGQPSMIEDVRADMDGKLRHQLGIGGTVTVCVQLQAAQKIEITRTFDGDTDPIKAVYAESRKPVPGDIAQLFPVLAYSQTETLQIAKDNQAHLKLIDSLLDLATIESRIATLETALDSSDTSIAAAESAEDQLEQAEKDLATHDEKISNLGKALKSKELETVDKLKPKSDYLAKVDIYVSGLEEIVDGLSTTFRKSTPPKLPVALAEDPDLKPLA
jgi:PHP family Zn ribbon phosphoesterase